MNWLLIVVLVLLAAFTLIGMHRGIIKMIFSVVSLVGTLIAVFILLPIMTDALRITRRYMTGYRRLLRKKYFLRKCLNTRVRVK